MIEHSSNGEARTRLTEQKKRGMLLGILRYPLLGIIGNRREMRLWRETRDPRLIPTLYSLGGLVNIQSRGRLPTAKELADNHPFLKLVELITRMRRSDAEDPANFGWHKGKLCLVDYGADWAVTLFARPSYQPTPFMATQP